MPASTPDGPEEVGDVGAGVEERSTTMRSNRAEEGGTGPSSRRTFGVTSDASLRARAQDADIDTVSAPPPTSSRTALISWLGVVLIVGGGALAAVAQLGPVDPFYRMSAAEGAGFFGLSPDARADVVSALFLAAWAAGAALVLARTGSWLWIPGLTGLFLAPGWAEGLLGYQFPAPLTLVPWQALAFNFADFGTDGLLRVPWAGAVAEMMVLGLPAMFLHGRPLRPRPAPATGQAALLAGLVAALWLVGGFGLAGAGAEAHMFGTWLAAAFVAAAGPAGANRWPWFAVMAAYGVVLAGHPLAIPVMGAAAAPALLNRRKTAAGS